MEKELAEYLFSDEYRRLLYRAITSRLGTTFSYGIEHCKAADLMERAFPGIGHDSLGVRAPLAPDARTAALEEAALICDDQQSRHWGTWTGEAVTCPRCLSKLAKRKLAPG